MSREDVIDRLYDKLKILSDSVWDRHHSLPHIEEWASQFTEAPEIPDDERIQALYLLSNFIYFGQREIRALLVSLYRDLFRAPMIRTIRKRLGGTSDLAALHAEYEHTLAHTRFLGVGNPSESGSHLLYYFRQENSLAKTSFLSSHQIFDRIQNEGAATVRVRDQDVEHYVFIDDLCGSGTQAEEYSRDLVDPLKHLNPNAKVHYLVLFGTTNGLQKIRELNRYDFVDSVFEIDESFKCLSDDSRIFSTGDPHFDRAKTLETCMRLGAQLWPSHPLGYKDGQLLIGFSHNTPDNTLPIFWAETGATKAWTPMFKRYHKIYG
ncbi:phosphoribosyltransferase-like protein [Stagnihabitans tardus]|uniref:PRTase-CE domain-containing protein n=1 Tax=Stagnihabitans tardus TaxID=2699202 RepID=A0AAE4YFG2_9RHOB|nr:hypothetical protein [Stagnihabitans tardus]NBZ89249.1 hypothetical protein [Stagnihabitans tardus]